MELVRDFTFWWFQQKKTKRNSYVLDARICRLWKTSNLTVPFHCLLFKKKKNFDCCEFFNGKGGGKQKEESNVDANIGNDSNEMKSNDHTDHENENEIEDNEEDEYVELQSLNDLYLNKLDSKELEELNYLFPTFKDKVVLSKEGTDNDDDNYNDDDLPEDLKINFGDFTKKENVNNSNMDDVIVKFNNKLYNLKDIEVKKINYENKNNNDKIFT